MQFKGIPAGISAGIVSGSLYVVKNLAEMKACPKDKIPILVSIKPNNELVKQSSVILAVHGGITSHAAILARENNVPAVVGLSEDILEYITNGTKVNIDTDKGIVVI